MYAYIVSNTINNRIKQKNFINVVSVIIILFINKCSMRYERKYTFNELLYASQKWNMAYVLLRITYLKTENQLCPWKFYWNLMNESSTIPFKNNKE